MCLVDILSTDLSSLPAASVFTRFYNDGVKFIAGNKSVVCVKYVGG